MQRNTTIASACTGRPLWTTLVLSIALWLCASAAFAAPKPALDAISASAGAPGARITLTGSHFGDAPSETSFVSFSGVRAETITWSDSQVVAVVPARAVAGYVGVTVDNDTSNGMWFAPNGRPQVTAISQTMAPPGTSVTILGTGFGATQRTGWVTFGGRPAPVISWSSTRIVAIVPPLTAPVWVGVWQNGAPSNGLLFMPFLPPEIQSASSTRVRPGQTLTVHGRRFGTPSAAGAGIKIGGKQVDPTEWTETRITFTVPADASSGYVGVWRAGVSSNGLYVYVAPEIDGLSSWWAEPGSTLTIDGEGFSAATRVTIAGQEAPILSQTATRIDVRVPIDAKEGYVGVWNGGAASNGVWLLPIYQARVSSLSASSAGPADTVVINGTHFGEQCATSCVRLGGEEMAIESWSDTQIRAVVPPDGESGYVGVWKRGIASGGRWLTVRP
jgi:hypothetical protein